jgi:hypothetical protein
VRTAGLRNKPLDRRYLSDKDKSDFNRSGAHGKQAMAIARVRAYKGQQSYRKNTPPRTTDKRPGADPALRGGISIQQQRLREYGKNKKSEFSNVTPSSKGDMFKKDE